MFADPSREWCSAHFAFTFHGAAIQARSESRKLLRDINGEYKVEQQARTLGILVCVQNYLPPKKC